MICVEKIERYGRLINYSINIFFNFFIFYIIFKFGSNDLISLFNRIDLIVAGLPLLFSLGIERVFIFSSDGESPDNAYRFLYTLITIAMGGALIFSFFIGLEILFAVVFAYIFAFSNISAAYSQVSSTKENDFLRVNIFKLVTLSGGVFLYSYEIFLFDFGSLFILLVTIASFIFLYNFKNLTFNSELLEFVLLHFPRSKFILLMTAIGVIYSNLPRIYELIVGSEYLSVKFFFWLKIMSYIGAFGLAFNYWLTKYIIFERGLINLSYKASFGVFIISAGLTGINYLNILSPTRFLEDQKIDQVYLILFSVTILSSFLRDVYIENILSLQEKFDKRYYAFLISAAATFVAMFVFYFIGVLSSLTTAAIFTSGTIFWMYVGILYAKKNERNFKFTKLWIYLAAFILINISLVYLI